MSCYCTQFTCILNFYFTHSISSNKHFASFCKRFSLSFFGLILSGPIKQIEVDTTNRWTILTFIFMILVLATVSMKKLFSRYQNKCDSSLKSTPFHPSQCLPCFNKTKEEETTILYSVKT